MAEEACQHHFVIGAARPGRSTSWGMCQKCGDVREFKNSIYVDNVVYWAKDQPDEAGHGPDRRRRVRRPRLQNSGGIRLLILQKMAEKV